MNMIDYLQLAINHSKGSFIWENRKIIRFVFDYIDPEDEEDGPAILALDDETGGNMHKGYYTKDITNLEVLD